MNFIISHIYCEENHCVVDLVNIDLDNHKIWYRDTIPTNICNFSFRNNINFLSINYVNYDLVIWT